MDLKREDQLTTLLACLIQDSSIEPFRWNKGKYLCFYCPATYNNITDLKDHTDGGHVDVNVTKIVQKAMIHETHVKVNLVDAKCNICDISIPDMPEYVQHLNDAHGTELDYEVLDDFTRFKITADKMSCVHCGASFDFFLTLNKHAKTHLTQYNCPLCDKGFPSKIGIFNHLNKIHTDSKHGCSHCNESFSSQHLLSNHIDIKHKGGIVCKVCNASYRNHQTLKRHMAVDHDDKNFQIVCEFCSKVFARNSKYVEHKQRVHLKIKNRVCGVCGYATYDREVLEHHMVRHNDARFFSCGCGKTFKVLKSLSRHLKTCDMAQSQN